MPSSLDHIDDYDLRRVLAWKRVKHAKLTMAPTLAAVN